MVCSENDTSINVTIPVVMIPQSAGKKLKDFLDNGASGKLFINYPSFSCKAHHDSLFLLHCCGSGILLFRI
jgi:hypothetical protein